MTNFKPYWLEEKDWLCIIEFLPRHDEEEFAMGAEAIGYFLGYSHLTNTRMIALLRDPQADAYELLFSFSSEENKRKFLALIQSNELTETEPDLILVPDASEIRNARPLGEVLPDKALRYATPIAMTLAIGSEGEKPN